MGDAIRFGFGPHPIAGAGEEIIPYTHDPKGKPSRVGLITVHLSGGTQTGKLCIRYGNGDINVCPEIYKGVFTANNPSCTIHPNFVIYPGESIYIWAWDVTAGDTIMGRIEGH